MSSCIPLVLPYLIRSPAKKITLTIFTTTEFGFKFSDLQKLPQLLKYHSKFLFKKLHKPSSARRLLKFCNLVPIYLPFLHFSLVKKIRPNS